VIFLTKIVHDVFPECNGVHQNSLRLVQWCPPELTEASAIASSIVVLPTGAKIRFDRLTKQNPAQSFSFE